MEHASHQVIERNISSFPMTLSHHKVLEQIVVGYLSRQHHATFQHAPQQVRGYNFLQLLEGTSSHLFALTVDGAWTDWADSTLCSASCGNGTKYQVRYCASPIPEWGGSFCGGLSQQVVHCTNGPCTESGKGFLGLIGFFKGNFPNRSVDGAWTEWSESSACSVSCGKGTMNQVRFCASPAPKGSGRSCLGPSEQTAVCNSCDCPANGKNSIWVVD